MSVLRKIILTEKVSKMYSDGVYGFWVDKNASKSQIKKDVEKKFNVLVKNVRSCIYSRKVKFFRSAFGANLGSIPAQKKAMVKLVEGNVINVYDF